VLEAREIDKWFGPVQALKKVSMSVYPAEIVALIGDNGAGKSTLINVLTGVFPPDGGQIFFQGEPVHFASPHDARAMGIETVYQDLAIAPHLAGPKQVADLRNGIVDVLIAQHPYDIGYTAVKMAVEYLNTKEPPKEKVVTTGYSVVTRDNVDDPEIKRYLYVADCSEIPEVEASPAATPA
jgi:ABC-type cobalamin/Fe3+-siderophores transport system ATPase subunit